MEHRKTPTSDWLFDFLREPLRPLLRIDADYEQAFDRFEYFVAMCSSTGRVAGWIPPGRFMWKREHGQRTFGDELRAEINHLGDDWKNWGPVRSRLFIDANEAIEALDRVEKAVHAYPRF